MKSYSIENAKIGPNSIIQTVEALKETCGLPRTHEILHRGGQAQWIDYPPSEMVSEQEFFDLIQVVIEQLGTDQARTILRQSGQRTAHYLLAHRIPGPFQRLVRILPRGIGLTALLLAIRKSAWTFVGSGQFRFVGGHQPRIIISNRQPDQHVHPELCSFYAGTFETLFQVLIDASTAVTEVDCRGDGETRCAYAISYRSQRGT